MSSCATNGHLRHITSTKQRAWQTAVVDPTARSGRNVSSTLVSPSSLWDASNIGIVEDTEDVWIIYVESRQFRSIQVRELRTTEQIVIVMPLKPVSEMLAMIIVRNLKIVRSYRRAVTEDTVIGRLFVLLFSKNKLHFSVLPFYPSALTSIWMWEFLRYTSSISIRISRPKAQSRHTRDAAASQPSDA